MSLPEQLQIGGLSDGDITAFEMLFRTYYQRLCNYAYSFLLDKEDAEEIVQSTFLMAWEKRQTMAIRTGILNVAPKVNGTQIGLINVADIVRGVPIGLMSLVWKGYHKIEISADEIFYNNLSFRTGVRQSTTFLR
ncbi:MAG TPA: sigma factor [Chryseosolibacter sp.]